MIALKVFSVSWICDSCAPDATFVELHSNWWYLVFQSTMLPIRIWQRPSFFRLAFQNKKSGLFWIMRKVCQYFRLKTFGAHLRYLSFCNLSFVPKITRHFQRQFFFLLLQVAIVHNFVCRLQNTRTTRVYISKYSIDLATKR